MKLHPAVQSLINEIEEFRDGTGMNPTAFGIATVNDGHFIHDLRNGRLPSLATIDKVRSFIRQHEKGRRETASA